MWITLLLLVSQKVFVFTKKTSLEDLVKKLAGGGRAPRCPDGGVHRGVQQGREAGQQVLRGEGVQRVHTA